MGLSHWVHSPHSTDAGSDTVQKDGRLLQCSVTRIPFSFLTQARRKLKNKIKENSKVDLENKITKRSRSTEVKSMHAFQEKLTCGNVSGSGLCLFRRKLPDQLILLYLREWD